MYHNIKSASTKKQHTKHMRPVSRCKPTSVRGPRIKANLSFSSSSTKSGKTKKQHAERTRPVDRYEPTSTRCSCTKTKEHTAQREHCYICPKYPFTNRETG